MKTMTVSSKYQIVISSAVRQKMGLQQGDKLFVGRVTGSEVVLKKVTAYHDLIGIVPAQPGDPVERIRQLREDWRQ